jgi:hypothetical protein
MKKVISIILALSLLLVIAACAADPPAPPAQPDPPPQPGTEPPTQPPVTPDPPTQPDPVEPEDPPELPEQIVAPFPGRIAIVTNTLDQNEEEFRSAEALVNRYGSDKVIHETWPVNFAAEGEMMITILTALAADPEVGAIIINQAVVNTVAAIDAVRAMRGDDIFIVVGSAAEDPADVSARVDLALDVNNPQIGTYFVDQALAMGAEAIVHISFPRHMAVPGLATRRDRMMAAAEAAGIPFHQVDSLDPMGEGGMAAAQVYIAENVERWVEEFGQNTVFFSTNCGQQVPLLQQILEHGAMYVQPCCPSPFHAFPTAFGLASHYPTGVFGEDGREILIMRDVTEIIEATSHAVRAAGLEGRLANWMVPASFVWTTVGFYYAVEWLNGDLIQLPGDTPDMDLIHRLIGDYIESIFGERFYMTLGNLEIGPDVFPMYVLGIVPYIVY